VPDTAGPAARTAAGPLAGEARKTAKAQAHGAKENIFPGPGKRNVKDVYPIEGVEVSGGHQVVGNQCSVAQFCAYCRRADCLDGAMVTVQNEKLLFFGSKVLQHYA